MSNLPNPAGTFEPQIVPAGGGAMPPGGSREVEAARPESWQSGGSNTNFQPSDGVRKRYLATRKEPFYLARITFPGLFDEQVGSTPTKATGDDLGWFKVAVVAELLTAAVLSLIVVNVFGLPFYAGLLPLAGILGLDGLLAVLHHLPAENHCLRDNQKLLVVRDLRAAGDWTRPGVMYEDFIGRLRKKTPDWHRWLPALCAALIILVAVGKTFFLAANIQEVGSLFRPAADGNIFASHSSLDEVLQRSEYRTAVLVVFGLLYSLVAYIHIKHTGYALAAIRLVQGLKRDRAQMDEGLAGDKFDRKPDSQRINLSEFARQLEEAKDPVYASLAAETRLSSAIEKGLHTRLSPEQRDAIAPHSISTEEDGDTYRLNALGVLTDKQLKAWADMQPTDLAKMAVALYGHSLQLRFIPGGTDIDIDIKNKRNK